MDVAGALCWQCSDRGADWAGREGKPGKPEVGLKERRWVRISRMASCSSKQSSGFELLLKCRDPMSGRVGKQS